jgi:hypothetical protein
MLRVRSVKITDLKPWDQNPRLNDNAVGAVAQSISKFGFTVPILCDPEMNIIAGHTRVKAARSLAMSKVPVIVLKMSGEQRRLFAITENKTGEIADWDHEILRRLLKEFEDHDLDLNETGFSAAELHALLSPREDFDWSCIEQEEWTQRDKDYVLFPIRIPVASIKMVKELVTKQSRKKALRGKDFAARAGMVFMHLLGVSQ